MLGADWDELPLVTWQRLGGFEDAANGLVSRDGVNGFSGNVPLPAQDMAELLRELRGDFGADSAFYQRVVARVRRGDWFTLERQVNGETLPTHNWLSGSFAHDGKIWESLFDKKWKALGRKCNIGKELPAAFARMLHDEDGVDFRAVYALLPLDGGTGRPGTERYVRTPEELALIDQICQKLASLAVRVVAPSPMVRSNLIYELKEWVRGIDQIAWMRPSTTNTSSPDNGTLTQNRLAIKLKRLRAELAQHQPKRLAPFCPGPTPFATEAAQREHASLDAAGDDDCWTDSLLQRMVAAVVHEGEETEALWSARDLDARMRRCETPIELRKPLQEFRAMMQVVRDRFEDRATRERHVDELRMRFVAAHGLKRPVRTRTPAKPKIAVPAMPLTAKRGRAKALHVSDLINDHWLHVLNKGVDMDARILKLAAGVDPRAMKALRAFGQFAVHQHYLASDPVHDYGADQARRDIGDEHVAVAEALNALYDTIERREKRQ